MTEYLQTITFAVKSDLSAEITPGDIINRLAPDLPSVEVFFTTSPQGAQVTWLSGTIAAGHNGEPDLGGGNLLPNSGFENATSGLTGWITYGSGLALVIDTTMFRSGFGAQSAKLVFDGTRSEGGVSRTASVPTGIPVDPGVTYTLSAYTRAASTARSGRVAIGWYTSSNTLIGGATVQGGTTTNSSAVWTRHVLTATAPSNAAYATVYAIISGTPANGETHYFDDLQFEKGYAVTTYAPEPDEILSNTAGSNYHPIQTPIAFTAAVAIPPELRGVSVAEYYWDFGDGTIGLGNPIEHTYKVANLQAQAFLQVTDSRGQRWYYRKQMYLQAMPLPNFGAVLSAAHT